jgi:prepilin-type N-terminal cleavage/methylation domain-containing protein/prepilin-type processing-associated H-X9-DG protein
MNSQLNWELICGNKPRRAFTLVELIVSIAITGILMGLLLPAVQVVREAARRARCQSNIKNMGLGLLNYESGHAAFPHGSSFKNHHSWGSEILPFLEQRSVYDKIDFEAFWADPVQNQDVVFSDLPIFHCPSSLKLFSGKTDYCGISGSYRTEVEEIESNGMLFLAVEENSEPVSMSSVIDGASQTIIVAEGATVMQIDFGFWACGLNCFGHEEAGVNAGRRSDEIVADHPGGANVVLVDGSVQFIGEDVDADTVAALCTRNGYEPISEF